MWIFESKHDHESTFYWTDFDDLGVVGKLALPAVDRRQNYHQPSYIDAFHGHVLNFGHFHAEKTPKCSNFDVFLSKKIGRKCLKIKTWS